MILSMDPFINLFAKAGASVNEGQYALFSQYAALLDDWNQRMNLTAITDAVGVSEKHFLDSVLLALFLPGNAFGPGATVIDVGTGAGFPGIPLHIMRSDLQVTLLDSLAKRVRFLETVVGELGLSAKCIHMRAEDAGRNSLFREHFDVATARAVAALPVLCEYCLPLVRIGGVFAAMKGPGEDISAARTAVKRLGGVLEDVREYCLPSGSQRMIVFVRKERATPEKFPRNPAQIAKNPLLA